MQTRRRNSERLNGDLENVEMVASTPSSGTEEQENVIKDLVHKPEVSKVLAEINQDYIGQDVGKGQVGEEKPAFGPQRTRNQAIYKCPDCSKQFRTRQIYIQHVQFHLSRKSGEIFKCPKCSFTCTKISGMNAHIQSHIGNLLYTCDICGYTSSNPIQLGRHRTGSHGEGLKKSKISGKDLASYSGVESIPEKIIPAKSQAEEKSHRAVKIKDTEPAEQPPKLKPAVAIPNTSLVLKAKPIEIETNVRKARANKKPQVSKTPGRKRVSVDSRTCPYCKKVFSAKGPLMNHIRIHTGEKPFKCEQCSYSCNQRGNLSLHMKTHRRGKTLIKCKLCAYVATNIARITIHTKEEHSNDGTTKSKIPTLTEAPKGTEIAPNMAEVRSLKVTKKPDAPEVLNMSPQSDSIKCKICSKQFLLATQHEDHLRLHTGEEPFGCASCNFSSTQMFMLRKHMKLHKIAAQIYRCKTCGFTTRLAGCLVNHVRANHPPDVTKLPTVSTETTPKKLLMIDGRELQVKTQHQKAQESDQKGGQMTRPRLSQPKLGLKHKNRCDLCPYVTTDKRSLVEHRYIHTGERPFKCDQCPFNTNRHGDMSIHRRRHTNERFICSICGKAFLMPRRLRSHLRSIHRITNAEMTRLGKNLSGSTAVQSGKIATMKSIAGTKLKFKTFGKPAPAPKITAQTNGKVFPENNKHLNSGTSLKPINYPPRVILVFENEWNELQKATKKRK